MISYLIRKFTTDDLIDWDDKGKIQLRSRHGFLLLRASRSEDGYRRMRILKDKHTYFLTDK